MAKKKTKPTVATKAVVKHASAAAGTLVTGRKQPQVSYRQDGSCVVTHMEYVRDVVATTAPLVQKVSINPQRTQAFPWLSAVATRFEMYRFRKLRFIHKPSCGTSKNGYVALGFDFDMYDSDPSKSELLTWKYSCKSAVWQACSVDVTQDSRLAIARYNNFSSQGGDTRLDFLGNLFIITESDTGFTTGELFVEYEIEFRQPSYKIPPSLYTYVESSGQSSSSIFASTTKLVGNMILDKISDTSFQINDVGQFLIAFQAITASGTPYTAMPSISFSEPPDYPNASWSALAVQGAYNATDTVRQYLLTVNVPSVLMTLGLAGGGSSGNSGFLRIGTYAKGLG